jgi:hypothetical protein
MQRKELEQQYKEVEQIINQVSKQRKKTNRLLLLTAELTLKNVLNEVAAEIGRAVVNGD